MHTTFGHEAILKYVQLLSISLYVVFASAFTKVKYICRVLTAANKNTEYMKGHFFYVSSEANKKCCLSSPCKWNIMDVLNWSESTVCSSEFFKILHRCDCENFKHE